MDDFAMIMGNIDRYRPGLTRLPVTMYPEYSIIDDLFTAVNKPG